MNLRNNQIKTVFVIFLIFLLQGCAPRMTALDMSGADDYDRILNCPAPEDHFTASGKAKLKFSRYRFRGVFRMEYKNGNLRIDFDHSSLLGAVKEEASIFIGKEGINVYDQKRDEFYNADASDKLIRDAVDGSVRPSDIILALLLKCPEFSEISSVKASSDNDKWKVGGIYNGREIEYKGKKGTAPAALVLNASDDLCGFSVYYRYAAGNKGGRYPEEITIRKEDGSVRVKLDIKSVK